VWGRVASLWLGWQVRAVDFSPAGVERGRRRAQAAGVEVDLVLADLQRWEPTAGAIFDLVVVAYLQLGDNVLARARSWLAPGGRRSWSVMPGATSPRGLVAPGRPGCRTPKLGIARAKRGWAAMPTTSCSWRDVRRQGQS